MTKQVNCGGVLIGGGAPVSIQSMTNVDTRDTDRLVRQIDELADAGCDDRNQQYGCVSQEITAQKLHAFAFGMCHVENPFRQKDKIRNVSYL
jgi:hypothetical protein